MIVGSSFRCEIAVRMSRGMASRTSLCPLGSVERSLGVTSDCDVVGLLHEMNTPTRTARNMTRTRFAVSRLTPERVCSALVTRRAARTKGCMLACDRNRCSRSSSGHLVCYTDGAIYTYLSYKPSRRPLSARRGSHIGLSRSSRVPMQASQLLTYSLVAHSSAG